MFVVKVMIPLFKVPIHWYRSIKTELKIIAPKKRVSRALYP